jgi:hypothetical protein
VSAVAAAATAALVPGEPLSLKLVLGILLMAGGAILTLG